MRSARTKRWLRLALTATFALLAFRVSADPPPLDLTEENIASVVDPVMTQWVEKHKGPGAVVVVVTRDRQVFAKGYGVADRAANKPFTADATLVRPGSISKLFTAIAVMQQVDAGKLDLDRDVNDYLDFVVPTPQGGVPVTLRRLLTHHAGFEEHVKELFSRRRTPVPLGRWVMRNQPRRLFPNGDVEAYSNYGFALAGYIVERVTGEPFVSYVQRHVLDPLGMRHSTFRQPLPDDLAPLMAKGYRVAGLPPLGHFETVSAAPAGALSATATDMGRFLRALMNGGALEGARILPQARLDEMMSPQSETPAGYLGLAFFGTEVAGHKAIWHGGGTTTFFSDLKFFPGHDLGIFVSRDGNGAIGKATELPDPATAIAQRFLPVHDAPASVPQGDPAIAGVYHLSRRAESSLVRMNELSTQFLVALDAKGDLQVHAAVWPFGAGTTFRRIGPNLYLGPASSRIAFIPGDGAGSHLVQPGLRVERVPVWLDMRWIVPAVAASVSIVLLTLLAWPFAALWRRWRRRRWSERRGDRRKHLAVRLIVLIDAVVIVVTAAIFTAATADASILSEALDPWLLALYALAWLGVLGAAFVVWAVVRFWRDHVGSRWSRIHHALIAASCVMLAWFFVVFRLAGTTLNY